MPEKKDCTLKKEPMSQIRKGYFARLVGRSVILVLTVLLYIFRPEYFDVLYGNNFFKTFSPLHIVWGIWIVDMVQQLIPVKKHLPLGSQKYFKQRFQPIVEKISAAALKEHAVSIAKSAYRVMLIWAVLVLVVCVLHGTGVLPTAVVFLISTAFYVCDLICVLIWCPFRLIMKNKCCTTCRIFNWDHMMMFTPMLCLNSVFSWTLIVPAFAVWLVWELCAMLYPERFWDKTNAALRCSECTDKLCTQYCQKLRK